MRNSLRVFTNRRYSIWVSAEFVASIAGWIFFTVQLWLIMTALDIPLNETAGLAGTLLVFQFLPQAFFSPLAGWLGDRMQRRTILVCSQIGLAAVAFVGGSLFLAGAGSVGLLYALAFGSGTLSAFDSTIKQAAAADYVDPADRREAVVGLSIVGNVSRLVGPALAGFLIVAISAPMALIVCGSLFIIAGAVIFCLPGITPVGASTTQRRGDTFRILRARPAVIVAIVVGFFIGALACHTSLMMTSMVLERGLNADSFSVISFALACGTLLGATMCLRLPLTLRWLLIASLGVGLAMMVVSRMEVFTLITGGFFVFGILLGSANTLTTTFVQISSPPESMGRVLGFYFMIFMGISPLSAPLLGMVIDRYGVATLLLGSGSVILLAMVSLLFVEWRLRVKGTLGAARESLAPAVSGP